MNRNSIILIHENGIENVVCQNGDHFVQGGNELTKYVVIDILDHSPWFSNVASDWRADLLAATQKLHLNIMVSYQCFILG